MEKLNIALVAADGNTPDESLQQTLQADPTLLDLCSPVFLDEESALSSLQEGKVSAMTLLAKATPQKPLPGCIEVVATDKTCFMPLPKEPLADDIDALRTILERDFDMQSPRIAIVWSTAMQNPSLASQVTEERGINTYGPFTADQFLDADAASHYDGIAADTASMQHLLGEIVQGAPVRYFAGTPLIVTAPYEPYQKQEGEDGLADLSPLMHPIFLATDIVRNRQRYDDARRNPLPKLFRDKREERRKEEARQANNNTDNTEKAS